MPIFLGKHTMQAGVTEEDVRGNWEKYKEAAVAKGLKPLHAITSTDEGIAYCETEAPNAQAVIDAHADAGVTVDEVVEVMDMQ